MGNKSVFTILLLIVALIASSLIAVQAYVVDSIAKPSTPEFRVQVVSHPYDVPSKTTTTIDQYTGKETTYTQPGYRVENKSIEITIKNQPFTPYKITTHTGYNHETGESYTYDQNSTVDFFYNIGVKGHYGDEWKLVGGKSSFPNGPESNAQLDAGYTVISIKAEDYPNDALLDFRVQAAVGYYVAWGHSVVIMGFDFYGQESDWSNIQTLTIGAAVNPTIAPTMTISPTTSITPTYTTQNPTSTPIQPNTQSEKLFGFSWEHLVLGVSAVVIIVLVVGLAMLWRKVASKSVTTAPPANRT